MALRHFLQMIHFFDKAGEYAAPDSDKVAAAGEDAPRYVSYHKRIVVVSAIFGLLGAAAGLVFLYFAATGKAPAKESDSGKIILAPVMFGAMGLIFGVSLMGLFAPTAFLNGPVGEKWMQLIGTKSTLFAKFLCFLVTMLFAAFLALMCWGAWADIYRPGQPLF